MLCSPKSRARTHSIHGNQPRLARVDPDDVWLNTDDAAARGIADGQKVRVFNDRGATVLPAKVTDRIAPGVVSIKEGAWFTPDSDGTDTQGLRQRAGRRPLGAVRRDDLQHESRRGRAGELVACLPSYVGRSYLTKNSVIPTQETASLAQRGAVEGPILLPRR